MSISHKGACDGLTSRYLTPLADAGYISDVGGENLHSPQRKYRLSVKRKKVVS